MTDELTPEQLAELTDRADISAPPLDGEPVALVLFGTNQQDAPVRIAADRYTAGAAPLIIATGGVNRHDGSTEGQEFARKLVGAGVPAGVIRVEDQSKDTWQNVELSLPYLREAVGVGLPLVVVSKWHHLRAVYCLRTQLPDVVPLYAIGWEPVYHGQAVTRETWPTIPDGRRRVIRETTEVARRVSEGSYLPAEKRGDACIETDRTSLARARCADARKRPAPLQVAGRRYVRRGGRMTRLAAEVLSLSR